ncbi:MAG: FG-GAP-like repeat-containing protein [Bryobacteraceae bacterium]
MRLTLIATLICCNAMAQNVNIRYQSSYGITGIGQTAPVAADFNHDGLLDLAICGASTISIYLGRGDGTFSAPTTTAMRAQATSRFHAAASGDFNGDGKADLAAFGGIYLGQGDGRLVYSTSTDASADLRALDMNGDGKDDLAGWVTGGYGMSLSTDFGGYSDPRMEYDHPQYATVIDANLDGYPDFLLAGSTWPGGPVPNIAISLPAENRVGEPVTLIPMLSSGLDLYFVGTQGVLVSSGTAQFRTVTSPFGTTRQGSFQSNATVKLALPATAILRDAAVVDLNHDGALDVAVILSNASDATLGYYLGDGRGAFGAFTTLNTFPASSANLTLTLGDWNNDTATDLATQDDSTVRFYLSEYTAAPGSRAVSSSSGSGWVAPGSLATLYGSFAAEPASTPSLNTLPTSLGGVTLTLRDQTGVRRSAGLLYVSDSQINFQVPQETALGIADITIKSGSHQSAASAAITKVAPGLFADQTRAPIGYALRIEPSGPPTVESAAEAITLDDRPVYLVLYATGLRGRSSLANVQCTIGGITIAVAYAGPAGDGVPGLDQVNMRLPQSLRGGGILDLILKIDGVDSNPVKVKIQ